jgi:hypothetical protein
MSIKSVLDEIQTERIRQIQKEGFSPAHDDQEQQGQMARAAACYAVAPTNLSALSQPSKGSLLFQDVWPSGWDSVWDKRKKHPHRRRLIIAASLLVAEIERLDRKAARSVSSPPTWKKCLHHQHLEALVLLLEKEFTYKHWKDTTGTHGLEKALKWVRQALHDAETGVKARRWSKTRTTEVNGEGKD